MNKLPGDLFTQGEIMEKTYDEWHKWFESEYQTEPIVLRGKGIEDSELQKLIRVWVPANGVAPAGEKTLGQGIFSGKKKNNAADGLIVFRSKGKTPIVFTTNSIIVNNKLKFVDKKSAKSDAKTEKPRSLTLKKPFLSRCRDCKEIGDSKTLVEHCGRRPKQLAPLSKEGREWFETFLKTVKWKYVKVDKLMTIPNISKSNEALAIAEQAGMSLEKIMSKLELQCPEHYELFDRKNTHIRTSNLKGKKSFIEALKSSIKNHQKTLPLLRTAPVGVIELGHIFDEFLSNMCDQVVGEIWQKGSKIRYYSPSLKIAVSGTPDLKYSGIPIEMKTVNTLPYQNIGPKKKVQFRNKMKSNYMTQLSVYSKSVDRQWILLLLISRESGEFTILPMSNETYLPMMESKLLKWSQDSATAKLLHEYHQLKGVVEN